MATPVTPVIRRSLANTGRIRCRNLQRQRSFQTKVTQSKIPNFGFAFDIDGVLVRSSTPIPGAHKALSYLQDERIPFVLLTNGGGKSEEERVRDLQEKLDVPLDTGMFLQSHTPFANLKQYHDKTVLVVGGDHDKCQRVAQGYGYKNVVTPGDIYTAYPDIWPFGKPFEEVYKAFAKPPPKPINLESPPDSLKIDAIFVYNDPRDWGLDASLILDLMLSEQGILGTLSKKNGDSSLPNNGYLQDGQPALYYSNPDLWWASSYHLNRLGQGGFQFAFDGLWNAVTGGAKLEKTTIGKPTQATYEYAENLLRQHRKKIWGPVGLNDPLKRVYMVGDNPESDIQGANNYQSPHGSDWTSVLVKTGVWKEGQEPSHKPDIIHENVSEAVQWAVEDARKRGSA
ncbi:uncharacterized protein LTR77_010002 [Saxophila tyrrhenica]|uniref:Uncharacterized protein n=1 Tax=Saxophila tyrrhenica TaxID=1690608 RepID=A0AAV9NWL8_9PEZI|nr:hypothetical protein LTR77_010002 [Saxophila tyrrhenica]